MKWSVRLGVLVLALSLATRIGAAAGQGFVHAEGKGIVTAEGKPLLLRGINLGNWLVPEGYMFKFEKGAESPRKISEVFSELVGPEEANRFWDIYRDSYITREDIHFIKASGLNSVRVPFNFRLFAEEGRQGEYHQEGFALLERLVDWCRTEGLWVILDMHCAPGGQTGDNIDDSWGDPWLFRSPGLQEQTIALWVKIAERFKYEPSVIGYDLLNEPISSRSDTLSLNRHLEPFYKRAVEAIRKVDPNHLIFLAGAQWDTNFRIFGPPFAPNLAYTFHCYWTDTTEEVIREYLDFRDRYRVPIWLGESGENDDAWITAFRGILDRNDVGWCFWPYKKPDAKSCMVTFRLPKGYSAIAQYAETPRGDFQQIREAMPDRSEVARILREYLENCRFPRCTVNEGYLRALGLTPPPAN